MRLTPEEVKAARHALGLTREALAEQADGSISEATIKRAESGRPVSLSKARTLAQLLDRELTALLGDSPKPKKLRSVQGAPAEVEDRPALIECEAHLTILKRAAQRARTLRKGLITIVGSPGTGKTALMHAAMEAFMPDALVCSGRGSQFASTGFRFKALATALAPHQRELASVLDAAEVSQLNALITARDVTGMPGIDSRIETLRQMDAVTAALCRTAERRAIVLILDDVQWLDWSSLDTIERLSEIVTQPHGDSPRGLWLVLASRPPDQAWLTVDERTDLANQPDAVSSISGRWRELMAWLQALPACETLETKPLSEAGTFSLLQRLGISHPEAHLVRAIYEVTAGNPLFVTQLVRVSGVQELAERAQRSGSAREFIRSAAPPTTLVDAVRARAASMTAAEQEALIVAGLLGSEFEMHVVAGVLNVTAKRLAELLDASLRAGLIKQLDIARCVFSHPIIRQVFCQTPEPSRCQALHGRIATYLHGRTFHDAALTRTLAYHGLFAGPHAPPDIDNLVRVAIDGAISTCAWDDAMLFSLGALRMTEYAETRSLQDIGELHRKAAYASSKGSNYALTQKHYREALGAFALAGDAVARTRVLSEIVRVVVQTDVPMDAAPLVAELDQILSDLGAREPQLQVQILDDLSSYCFVRWEPERAAAYAERGAHIADELGDARLRAQVSTSRALSLLAQMQIEAALSEWQLGLQLSRRAGDRVIEAVQAQRIPIPAYALGRLEDVERSAREALLASEQAGNLGEPGVVHAIVASAHTLRAQFTKGIQHASRTIELARRSGYPWAVPDGFLALTCCRTHSDDLTAAQKTAEEMADRTKNGRYPGRLESLSRLATALVAAYGGHKPESVEVSTRPRSSTGLALASLPRICMRVQLLDLLGRADHADALRDNLAYAHAKGVVLTSGWPFVVQRLLGVASMLLEDWDAARVHLDAALTSAQRLDARLEYAHVLHDRVQLAVRCKAGSTEIRQLRTQAQAYCESARLPTLARRIDSSGV